MVFVEHRKKVEFDRKETATSESCNTHTLYHSVKGIIPKIIYNNRILHYDAKKRTTLNKL